MPDCRRLASVPGCELGGIEANIAAIRIILHIAGISYHTFVRTHPMPVDKPQMSASQQSAAAAGPPHLAFIREQGSRT